MAKASNAAIQTASETTIAVSYPVHEDELRKTFARFKSISFDTPEGYEEGRKALAACRATRSAIEERRKYLKADSLAYGKKVDSRAKELTAIVEDEFENELRAKKEAIDNAKELARRAAEDAEREAIRLAEQAKLEEQRAELARIEEEQRVAREAETLRQAEESQRLAAASAELARQAEAQAEERAAFQRERDAFEAQRRAATPLVPVTQEAVDAALAEDLAEAFPGLPPVSVGGAPALAPPIDWVAGESQDSARLRAFAAALRAVPRPAVDSDTAAAVLEQVEFILEEAFQALESFGGSEKEAATAAE